MIQAVQMLLYVQDPAKSADFYADLLGYPARKLSPFFAVVKMEGSLELAFWARSKAPAARTSTGESGELCLVVQDGAELRALHAAWAAKAVTMLQAPKRCTSAASTSWPGTRTATASACPRPTPIEEPACLGAPNPTTPRKEPGGLKPYPSTKNLNFFPAQSSPA